MRGGFKYNSKGVLVRRAHLTVGGIATELEEMKFLIRPGTGSLAHGPRRSESLNSVGLPGRPKAGTYSSLRVVEGIALTRILDHLMLQIAIADG
jgi:hypothetical protein